MTVRKGRNITRRFLDRDRGVIPLKAYSRDPSIRLKQLQREYGNFLAINPSHTKESLTRDVDYIYNLFAMRGKKYIGWAPKKESTTMFIFKEDEDIETMLGKLVSQTPREGVKNLVHFIDLADNYSYLKPLNDPRFLYHDFRSFNDRHILYSTVKTLQGEILESAERNGFHKAVARGADILMLVDTYEGFTSFINSKDGRKLYEDIIAMSGLTSIYPVFCIYKEGLTGKEDLFTEEENMRTIYVLSRENFMPLIDSEIRLEPRFSAMQEMIGVALREGEDSFYGLHHTKYRQSTFGRHLKANIAEKENFLNSFLESIDEDENEVLY